MSELAFNLNGEPFEILPNMAAWRVRKLKPKGAPEVVYGRDGLPLFLPLDADIEDLRREARGEGRYRLDPVDDRNRAIPNAQAAYVCVHPIEREPEPKAHAVPVAAMQAADTTAQLVSALLESQRQHTEMAKMYVSQFPTIVNALSGVVKSAGDAGLTARVPLVLPPAPGASSGDAAGRDAQDDDEEEVEKDENDEIDQDTESELATVAVAQQPEYSWARVAQTLADQVSPHVAPLLAGIPGLAAMLGAQRAKTGSDGTRGPDQRDPAPAAGEIPVSSGPAGAFDAGMLVRLNAIKAQLTPVERQFAQSLLDEIPAEELPVWLEKLRAMSADDAVAHVRAMFREGQVAAVNARPAVQVTAATRSAPDGAPLAASVPPTGQSKTRREGWRSPVSQSPVAVSTTKRPMRRTVPSKGLELLEEGTQAHFAAIDHALTLEEAAALRRQFAAMSPRDRASWVATLVMLPVAHAVAAIRAQLAASDAPVVAQGPGPTAGTSAVFAESEPVAIQHDADSHLAEVERGLTAEERVQMHTMFSNASAEEREVWLDRLLSVSPAQGTAMLRVALAPAISQPLATEPQIDGAPTTPTAPARGQGPAIPTQDAASEMYEPTIDEIDLAKEAAVHTSEDLDEAIEAAGDDAADLDDIAQVERARRIQGEPDSSLTIDRSTPPDRRRLKATGDVPQNGHAPETLVQAPGPFATPAMPSTSETSAATHFQAIEAALTLAERMRAHELAAQRSTAELRDWYADLLGRAVPEAVAKIRAELARSDSDPNTTKKGGVS